MKTPSKAARRADPLDAPEPEHEPQASKEPQPMTLQIEPPRTRKLAAVQHWAPPRKGGGQDWHERGKTPAENALQGRLERDPAPLVTLTDELLATAREQALLRLTVAELAETI